GAEEREGGDLVEGGIVQEVAGLVRRVGESADGHARYGLEDVGAEVQLVPGPPRQALAVNGDLVRALDGAEERVVPGQGDAAEKARRAGDFDAGEAGGGGVYRRRGPSPRGQGRPQVLRGRHERGRPGGGAVQSTRSDGRAEH